MFSYFLVLIFRKATHACDGIRLNNGFLYRCVGMGYSNFKLGCSVICISVVEKSYWIPLEGRILLYKVISALL